MNRSFPVQITVSVNLKALRFAHPWAQVPRPPSAAILELRVVYFMIAHIPSNYCLGHGKVDLMMSPIVVLLLLLLNSLPTPTLRESCELVRPIGTLDIYLKHSLYFVYCNSVCALISYDHNIRSALHILDARTGVLNRKKSCNIQYRPCRYNNVFVFKTK